MVRLNVLGTVTLTDRQSPVELPGPKPLAVLIYLAVERRPVPRSELAELLWPGSGPRGKGSVRQALYALRTTVGEDIFRSPDDPVEVDASFLEVDAFLVDERIRQGEPCGCPALWRGAFLEAFPTELTPPWADWVDTCRASIETRHGLAFLQAGRERMRSGDGGCALELFEGSTRLLPQVERTWVGLVEFHLAHGDAARAGEELVRARSALVRSTPTLDDLQASTDRLKREEHPNEDATTGTRIGPSDVLSALRAAWLEADRHPGRVVLSGPQGSGKSRVIGELAAFVTSTGGHAVVARRGAGSIKLHYAAALIHQLRSLPGAAGISRASQAVLGWLIPDHGIHVGDTTPAVDSAAFPAGVADLIAAVAEEAPLLVVLDDFDEADVGSRESLLAAVDLLPDGHQILVVRTSDGTVQHDGGGRAWSRRSIPALELRDARELLLATHPGLSRDEVERGWRVSGGWPGWLQAFSERAVALGAERAAEEVGRARLDALGSEATRTLACIARGEALDDPAATHSLRDLGIIERDPTGAWRIRDSALAAAGDPDGVGLRRSRFAALAVVGALATLGIAGMLRGYVAGEESRPWSHLDGGVRIVTEVGVFDLVPPDRAGGRWRAAPTREVPRSMNPIGARIVGRDTVWYGTALGRDPGRDAPVAVELSAGDSIPRILVRGASDAAAYAVAPRGRWSLATLENATTPAWDMDLLRIDRETGRVVDTLIHGLERAEVDVSPDGNTVALLTATRPDTLLLLRPNGVRIGAFPVSFESARHPRWCGPDGDRIVLGGVRNGLPDLFVFRPAAPHPAFEPIPLAYPLVHAFECIGDGVIVYAGVVDDKPGLVVREWADGAASTVDIPGAPAYLYGIRGPGRPGLDSIDLPESVQVGTGRRTTLEVGPELPDGTPRTALKWSSRNPSVASVSPEGTITANMEGRTVVRGTYRGWITDSTRVTVFRADDSETLILRDAFGPDWTERWAIEAEPGPVAVRTEDSLPALHLRGDGRFADWIIHRQPVDASLGATIELDFRMPLSRRDHQRLSVCLTGGDDPALDRYVTVAIGYCVTYPVGNLSTHDSTSINVNIYGLPTQQMALTPSFTSAEWNHLAWQIQPDGHVSVFMNGRAVGRSAHRRDPAQIGPLQVRIAGAGRETELVIRNLRVWRGLRYGGAMEP